MSINSRIVQNKLCDQNVLKIVHLLERVECIKL